MGCIIGFDVNGSGDAQNCRPDAPCGISCGSTTGCEQENVGIHIVQVGATADSIFGEHSDVMATRSTGVCILSSHSVQEVMDLALVAHVAGFSTILLIFFRFRQYVAVFLCYTSLTVSKFLMKCKELR